MSEWFVFNDYFRDVSITSLLTVLDIGEDNLKLSARLGKLESDDRMNQNYRHEIELLEQNH